MQFIFWLALGAVIGIIAMLLTRCPAGSPPPLVYLRTNDESLGALVAPSCAKRSSLWPMLLGMAAAMGGGWLGALYEFRSVLPLGSIAGFDAASAISAGAAALLVSIGYSLLVAITWQLSNPLDR